MSSLIEQIQADAINREVPTSDLLRKVKLASAKLKLPKVEQWVDLELKGYKDDGQLPEYRITKGVLQAFNPYFGWKPIGGCGGSKDV